MSTILGPPPPPPKQSHDDDAALVAWETILTLAREYGLGVHKDLATKGNMVILATPAYQRQRQIGPHGRSKHGQR